MAGIDEKTGMPRIGDGELISVPDNKVRKPLPGKEENIQKSLELMGSSDEKKESAEEDNSTSPEELAKRYLKDLENVGISLEEARHIQEQLFIHGCYEEDFKLGPVTIRLRSKTSLDTVRVHRALERERPEFPATAQDIINRYSVAASLSMYGETKFNFPDSLKTSVDLREEAFDKRYDFVNSLPEVVLVKLIQKSIEFDKKLSCIFAEGAPQDF
jgi:hypothetical protein